MVTHNLMWVSNVSSASIGSLFLSWGRAKYESEKLSFFYYSVGRLFIGGYNLPTQYVALAGQGCAIVWGRLTV